MQQYSLNGDVNFSRCVDTEDTSQILTVLSSDALAKKLESADQAPSEMPCLWPLKTETGVPVRAFHIRTVVSAAGESAKHFTLLVRGKQDDLFALAYMRLQGDVHRVNTSQKLLP
jgi:GH25 family lysozyme M1 (1,4-beta-N-acetylmuramidase)